MPVVHWPQFLISVGLISLLIFLCMLECNGQNSTAEGVEEEHAEESTTQISSHEEELAEEFSDFLNNRNCECGVRRREPGKIVGGTVSEENTWPWIGALIYTGGNKPKQFCGSTLINDRYLISAAHCVRDIPSRGQEKFKVFLGGNMIPQEYKDFREISYVKMHPRFNRSNLDNDLALIRLAKPVKFSDNLKPVCLSQRGAPFAGNNATVIGWGWTLEGNLEPGNVLLREVEVKIIHNHKCQESYDHIGVKITPSMMCAGFPGKDSCKGDSGGPLLLSDDTTSEDSDGGRHSLIGVVSYGQACASPTYPGVYTRVSKLMSWIKKNTKDAFTCMSRTL